jgi:hypothetical protein
MYASQPEIRIYLKHCADRDTYAGLDRERKQQSGLAHIDTFRRYENHLVRESDKFVNKRNAAKRKFGWGVAHAFLLLLRSPFSTSCEAVRADFISGLRSIEKARGLSFPAWP